MYPVNNVSKSVGKNVNYRILYSGINGESYERISRDMLCSCAEAWYLCLGRVLGTSQVDVSFSPSINIIFYFSDSILIFDCFYHTLYGERRGSPI